MNDSVLFLLLLIIGESIIIAFPTFLIGLLISFSDATEAKKRYILSGAALGFAVYVFFDLITSVEPSIFMAFYVWLLYFWGFVIGMRRKFMGPFAALKSLSQSEE